MKSQTIYKTNKTTLVHPAKVRSLLKKNGIKVGFWADNGRITGLSNFHGDVEVKETQLSFNVVENVKLADGLWKMVYEKVSTSEVISQDKKVLNKIEKLLKANSFKVKRHKGVLSDSLILK